MKKSRRKPAKPGADYVTGLVRTCVPEPDSVPQHATVRVQKVQEEPRQIVVKVHQVEAEPRQVAAKVHEVESEPRTIQVRTFQDDAGIHHELAVAGPMSEDALGYLEASTPENTRRSYAAAWAHFAAWCEARGEQALPASPATVANYAADLAECFKLSTIRHRISVINQAHEARGIDGPGKNRLVRKVLHGIARSNANGGTAKKKAEPLLTAHLQVLASRLDREGTLEAKRDKALLLVGFAGAFRRSELGAIRVEDLAFEDAQGVKVSVRASKTDQEGEGQAVGIAYGRLPATCPVNALRDWLRAAGIKSGPVFQSFRRGGHLTGKGLSGEAIRQIIRLRVAEVLGPEAALDFSGHSLRRGFVSQGALNGATERGMMKQTRHKSLAVFRDYIKDFGVWQDNESATLGL